jgi:hypothetical protein
MAIVDALSGETVGPMVLQAYGIVLNRLESLLATYFKMKCNKDDIQGEQHLLRVSNRGRWVFPEVANRLRY